MALDRHGEHDDGTPDSPEELLAHVNNLRYWIGELVSENHRLRMALRDRRNSL